MFSKSSDFLNYIEADQRIGKKVKRGHRANSIQSMTEDDGLKLFPAAGWIEASSVDEVAERKIQPCVEERCKHRVHVGKLYVIDQEVKRAVMCVHTVEAGDIVLPLLRKYCNASSTAGYWDMLVSKLHIAISHILWRLKAYQLHCKFSNVINRRKNKSFH